ncbi:hypothetical protein COLO4_21272 [Corchorus olitorius]|uniref:Uncharacterized protein n=1 Tax=Corchorus olitorius TaxID=93759 RepID=A0A1R3IUF1_9ROSI|nr:hypothetical protein COLO4_21272 [Corchorus olitorius]
MGPAKPMKFSTALNRNRRRSLFSSLTTDTCHVEVRTLTSKYVGCNL